MNTVLQGIISNNRLAGAYLFAGGSSEDKLGSARSFAETVNCLNGTACGQCQSCHKASKGVHPDIIIIEREDEKNKISLEQMQQLKRSVRFGPSESKKLFAIIKEADILTAEASNSLLKVVEEPPDNVIFIFICEREDALPRTIYSRCQIIRFKEQECDFDPGEEEKWLYDGIEKISGMKVHELLDLSQKVAQIKERVKIQDALYGMLLMFRKDKKFGLMRVVMESIKAIKKNANIKLALDTMFIRMGEKNV